MLEARKPAFDTSESGREGRGLHVGDRRVQPESFPLHPEPPGKRPIDFLLAAAMLTPGALVGLPIALAIKLEDRGPVFYRQARYGKGGRVIHVLKFRTMTQDCDELHGIRQAQVGDDRITRVGRFLRSCGLDELPQVLNILRGEMSFVGPRPLAVGELVEDRRGKPVPWEETPGFGERLAVRPGLTSLATIYLAKDAHPRRKFAYDLKYVRRQSLAMDLRLIALSFWISFSGRWEKREDKL